MDCPVCKAPGMCVCPSPETTDVRERARRVVVQAMDYKLLVPHAFKIIDALAAANLLRTPNVAATGGASAETLSPQDRDALERLRYLRNEHGSMNGRIRPEDAGAYALGFSDASIGRRVEVTRLTEDLAARTGERDALAAQVYVSGQWTCPKCKFTLQQMVMSKTDGSVAAQDKPGEPCPNCRSPLWRTTWKQEASDMLDRATEHVEAYKAATALADALQQRVGALELILDTAHGGLICLGASMDDKQWADYARRLGDDITTARTELDTLSQNPTPNAKTEGV